MAERTIRLIGKDGKAYVFPANRAAEALASGEFSQESPEQVSGRITEQTYSGVLPTAAEAVTSAARGASLGLSDIAATKLGIVSPSALRTSREASPIASTAGEVTGALAGSVLPAVPAGAVALGGAKLASAVGRGVASVAPKGIAGAILEKAAAQGARGAAEGAVYGAASEVNESVLGDTELTAQALLASVGIGSMLGGSIGGVLGAAPDVSRAIGATAAKNAIVGKAKAAVTPEALEKLSADRALKAALGQQVGALERLANAKLKEKAGEYVRDVIGVSTENTTEIAAKIASRADEVRETLKRVVATADELTDIHETAAMRITPGDVSKRAREKLLPELKKNAADRDLYAKIKNEVDAIDMLPNGPMSFEDARQQRAALQDRITYARLQGLTREHEAYNKLSNVWNDVIDEKIEPVLDSMRQISKEAADALPVYRQARHESRLIQDIAKYSEHRAFQDASNRYISPSDYATGMTVAASISNATGLQTGFLGGLVATLAHKQLRERGSSMVSAAAMKASRLMRARSEAAASVAKISDAAHEVVLGKAKEGSVRLAPSFAVRVATEKNFEEDSRTIIEAVADKASLAKRLQESVTGLSEASPTVAAEMMARADAALTFLAGKLPPKRRGTSTLSTKELPPSATEISRWYRYYNAVMSPSSVLENAKNGRVSSEGIEVLKTVYPRLYAEIGESMKSLPDADLKYSRRLSAGRILGVQLDTTMDPSFIKMIQESYGKQQESSGNNSSKSVVNPSLSNSMMTTSQKLESNK